MCSEVKTTRVGTAGVRQGAAALPYPCRTLASAARTMAYQEPFPRVCSLISCDNGIPSYSEISAQTISSRCPEQCVDDFRPDLGVFTSRYNKTLKTKSKSLEKGARTV
jgi:hypothetical protein